MPCYSRSSIGVVAKAFVLVTASKSKKTRRSSSRRRGVETSATRAKLIDATQQLIVEEGYAAVTARRVASKAELKPQLVHYYFPTMDDLLVAVVRRGGDQNLERLATAVASEQPLKAVWELGGHADSAILSIQFLALATHRPAVRAEVKRYAEQLRVVQTAALTRYFELHGIEPTMAPISIMIMTTSLASMLRLERALGISLGHDETHAFVQKSLRDIGEKRGSPFRPDAVKAARARSKRG